ncbi:unnamed protein product [Protopolystoma xenopodis]|uniref:Uncharacterized protein n=1 Tax=Protopolystoma xenopodis TaxID=117903 RepID=A0A3S5APD4_9PLAT|nr:unnamed protein product [Protopolystoma xenopodis]
MAERLLICSSSKLPGIGLPNWRVWSRYAIRPTLTSEELRQRVSAAGGGSSGSTWSDLTEPSSLDRIALRPGEESYHQPKFSRPAYNQKLYEGGLLPRLPFTDKPVDKPEFRPKDMWAPHRAVFGQNDYIGEFHLAVH